MAAFHEALRIILGYGRRRKASDYAYHEKALRQAVEAMGCDVTSNMTSLVVLNLPGKLNGKEKELVAGARAQGFGIWPTLSEPIQVRIGILNRSRQRELYRRAHNGDFEALVLIADRQTLGQIRPILHKEVKDRLVSEIGKVLVRATIKDIQKVLQ